MQELTYSIEKMVNTTIANICLKMYQTEINFYELGDRCIITVEEHNGGIVFDSLRVGGGIDCKHHLFKSAFSYCGKIPRGCNQRFPYQQLDNYYLGGNFYRVARPDCVCYRLAK